MSLLLGRVGSKYRGELEKHFSSSLFLLFDVVGFSGGGHTLLSHYISTWSWESHLMICRDPNMGKNVPTVLLIFIVLRYCKLGYTAVEKIFPKSGSRLLSASIDPESVCSVRQGHLCSSVGTGEGLICISLMDC